MRRKMTNESITAADLRTISGWEQLKAADENTVLVRTEATANALKSEGQSRLEAGKNLLEVREILLPLKIWVSYLRTAFHMSERTGYRYIQEYEDTAKTFQSAPKVLDIAMARGYKAVARPELVRRNPPPKTEDMQKIVQYLDTLEESPPEPRSNGNGDSFSLEDRLKICFRMVASHYDKLLGKRDRTTFARTLLSLELTKFGMGSADVRPAAVPEEYTSRGRPREKKAA